MHTRPREDLDDRRLVERLCEAAQTGPVRRGAPFPGAAELAAGFDVFRRAAASASRSRRVETRRAAAVAVAGLAEVLVQAAEQVQAVHTGQGEASVGAR